MRKRNFIMIVLNNKSTINNTPHERKLNALKEIQKAHRKASL